MAKKRYCKLLHTCTESEECNELCTMPKPSEAKELESLILILEAMEV